jgi:two-component system phosphate regulon sensor histidine kinase PhoR
MFSPRRWFPITLGVVMIVLVVALIIGWIILAVINAIRSEESAGVYWALLSVGIVFLVLVLVGVVLYLSLSIKAIDLGRRQSNFIDAVTHELKSPIASLKLYLQTLSRRQLSPSQQAGFFHDMLDDVERLDLLINHVLDAARVEQGAAPELPPQDVELAHLIRRVVVSVCERHPLPTDAVALDLTPCTVHAYAADLEIILRNVIDNAVKYAGTPPRVAITLALLPEGRAVIRVGDNGPGVPREMRRKIFGRFVRSGSELERTKPGTGLGLHIVGTLVRRMKGKIRLLDPATESVFTLDDTTPNAPQFPAGAIFEITLPGASPVPTDQPTNSAAEVAARTACPTP